MNCHTCGAPVSDPSNGYRVRGVWRPLCTDLQACGERAVALRLGIPAFVQQAFFASQARGLVAGTLSDLVGA